MKKSSQWMQNFEDILTRLDEDPTLNVDVQARLDEMNAKIDKLIKERLQAPRVMFLADTDKGGKRLVLAKDKEEASELIGLMGWGAHNLTALGVEGQVIKNLVDGER